MRAEPSSFEEVDVEQEEQEDLKDYNDLLSCLDEKPSEEPSENSTDNNQETVEA